MFGALFRKNPSPSTGGFDFRAFAAPARAAARLLAVAPDEVIDKTLQDIAAQLNARAGDILAANQMDVGAAREKDLAPALIDRLALNDTKIAGMAEAVAEILRQPHPAGKVLSGWQRPNGLEIYKMSVPIGVLGMIYESRPNVTIDAAALCLKSRNAVVLRGGSEARNTNRALHAIIRAALAANGLPESAVLFIDDTDRAIVGEMLAAHDLIDVLIPRGGKGLTERVMTEASMPVFAHLDGNCHVYIHASARRDLALAVTLNAKLRRTGICGAAESLLIDAAYDGAVEITGALLDAGCEIVGDEWAQSLDSRIAAATPEDWRAEYLDKKISVKRVNGIDEAIAHINQYGSHHTDAILTEDDEAAGVFLRQVDSAIVLHNASTQFADGGEFGFGAEIGIGTGKLHARGPVGLEQLCTFKYAVRGRGQTRA